MIQHEFRDRFERRVCRSHGQSRGLGSSASAGTVVYSVTYDTTLHAMLDPPQFGPAQAVLKDPATVELAFNPFVDHGAFSLHGVLRGDSVTGEWQRTNFADDGYRGTFTMVRRR